MNSNTAEIPDLYTTGAAGSVPSATGLLATLASFVQTLNLSNGISNSLDTKLQNALEAWIAAGGRLSAGVLGAVFAWDANFSGTEALYTHGGT